MVGGKRAGAGRPKLPPGEKLLKVHVALPAEYVTWAREQGHGNISEGLRRLLDDLDQRQGAEVQRQVGGESRAPA